MKTPEPELRSGRNRDSSYGRLLRRLDQAMDMARTRQWLNDQAPGLTELEIKGLSKADVRLLWRILDSLETGPQPLPNYLEYLDRSTSEQAQQQPTPH